jgi:aminoglycoside phosphotransferase (APT) family kinase protein
MRDLDEILTRIERELGARLGEATALSGGITNRNYRVAFGTRDYVVRLPGKDTALLGISRDAERLAAGEAARLRIGPQLVFADADCFVTEYAVAAPIEGPALAADPAPVARALRAFHDSGLELPVRFWVPELLEQYALTVAKLGGALPGAYRSAQALVAQIAQVLPLREAVPCHDDLLAANLLATPDRILLVDWEYAGMGHRLFDLANLAVNNEFDDGAQEQLLEAYFGAPAGAGQRAALALMRIVSDAREAAWGVVQGLISELEFDFAGYAQRHYERLARAAADPRLTGWMDAAST